MLLRRSIEGLETDGLIRLSEWVDEWARGLRASLGATPERLPSSPANPPDIVLEDSVPQAHDPPPCPSCGGAMHERRTPPEADRRGTAFWGCRRFPACGGTLPQ